ncbi:preprotein translocase subunit SecA [bacterium]|nr:preprotein translocase subunit SecA [bacterium]
MRIFDFYQKWANQREIGRLQKIVAEINRFEPEVKKLKDKDFPAKVKKLAQEIKKGKDRDVLPYVFALVREAAWRTLGQRHFDEQLMGGVVLYEGKIAEMKTGEGKTLAATLPLTLMALKGKGAHLVTVNDYLARRDASWMGSIYNFLGLSVGVIQQQGGAFVYDPGYGEKEAKGGEETVFVDVKHLRPASRKEAYACDITYGTNNEFGFDYLRDNMARQHKDIVQRELYYAIIDEVDSVLIDEARTPLIISAPAEEAEDLYTFFARLVKELEKDKDYELDEKERAVSLTDRGTKKVERILGVKNLYNPLATKKYGGAAMLHYLYEALQAKALYHRDKDYIVRDGRVIIVDEFTGRLMPDRRYSEGLHQAIEAKEGVKIRRESITLATISFQNYFGLYRHLAGMTGTALTEAEEFRRIYNLEVVVIPTHRPMIRKDWADRVYKSEKGKFKAVVKEIKQRHQKGQPLLVGTLSIEKSEYLSQLLKQEGIKHEVLNAKHHEREAKIIAKAGQKGAVTIATNMAGRGVDIILGPQVKKLGGLCVVGTERHESRRIDNQLRGRAGRQGDLGESIFFVSLEDELMRIFGGERIKNLMTMLKIPEDEPIESRLVSRAIESAQKKVEAFNFDLRKHLLEFDNVLNKQRERIYKERRAILLAKGDEIEKKVFSLLKEFLLYLSALYFVDKKQALGEIEQVFGGESKVLLKVKEVRDETGLFSLLLAQAKSIFKERRQKYGEVWIQMLKQFYLSVVDSLWVDHLTIMEDLRRSVSLRGYGQRDPLVEYKKEGFKLFSELKESLKEQLAKVVLRAVPQLPEEEEGKTLIYEAPSEQQAAGTFSELQGQNKDGNRNQDRSSQGQTPSFKIGRNELCPCGSGKKYKKCHLGKPLSAEEQRLFQLYINRPEEWEKETGQKIKRKK